MNRAIQAAQRAARKAIEATYCGILSVSERQSVKDPVTHITHMEEVVVLENHSNSKRGNNSVFFKWCSRRISYPSGNYA